jgi:hypothetical protein
MGFQNGLRKVVDGFDLIFGVLELWGKNDSYSRGLGLMISGFVLV